MRSSLEPAAAHAVDDQGCHRCPHAGSERRHVGEEPARYYSPEYLERVAPTLYGGEIRQAPGLLREQASMRVEQPPTKIGYYYQIAALRRWSSLPWLHRLPHRTLVLAGEDDPIIALANGRILASRIPAGRLHVVEGGGHLFLFTRAAEIAERISEFLDTGASAARRQLRTETPTNST